MSDPQHPAEPPIMATAPEFKVVRECIEAELTKYRLKGAWNKRGAIFVQVGIVVLSACTTILIGWKNTPLDTEPDEIVLTPGIANLALIFSALVTGLNVISAFFDYKELWVQYKVASHELQTLLNEINFLEAGGIGKITRDQLMDILKRHHHTCSKTNEIYQKLRLEMNDTNNKQDGRAAG